MRALGAGASLLRMLRALAQPTFALACQMRSFPNGCDLRLLGMCSSVKLAAVGPVYGALRKSLGCRRLLTGAGSLGVVVS